MRRYLLVRAAWQVGALFVFVSLAYVVAWVVPDETTGRDPGYGGFLSDLAHGSLGRTVGPTGRGAGPSVGSVVWDAARVTLSLLLITGLLSVALGSVLAFAAVRWRRGRAAAWAVGIVGASLLPVWTALYLAFYPGFRWGLVRFGGYCPVHATKGFDCHGFGPWLSSLLLPALALAIFFGAIYGRSFAAAFRHGMAEYRGALDDGDDPLEARRSVRRRYGLRFGKLLSRDFAFAIGFAAFIEVVFSLPGLGDVVVIAATNLDASLMAGALVAASVLTAGLSFLVDVGSAVIDPRFRRF